ncbi:hypothetical protein [Candidatus Mycoplasma haematohominis]|uniref:hypothetical protein n=1 Tax=Candidatus Mycoplasma haematohominis TaxID=1494318 RepID=UPI001C0A7520|nr:hypothetical protein [Candidatus Mycoplasma haemohominis]
MGFRPCIDFFRKNKKILLTQRGQKKLQNVKITGTKIPFFFKLNLTLPEEKEEYTEMNIPINPQAEITPYQIWSQVFNFPFVPKRNPKKQEKYRTIEEKIKNYLEKNLNKSWINYPLEKYDIFEGNDIFGGVPDGEERDNKGNPISILEIKTITDIKNQTKINKFSVPPLNYQLQLALYLYLKGIDTGYICICYMNPENWEDLDTLKLKTTLTKYTNQPKTFTGNITSWIDSIGECPYEYQLLEAYCNDFLNENEIILFKIKIDMEKYKAILEKLCKWFTENRTQSPTLMDKELKNILNNNKNW